MTAATLAGSLVVASVLALAAWIVGRSRHVAVAHVLWLLVLLKLLVPPLFDAPIIPSLLRPAIEPDARAHAVAPAPKEAAPEAAAEPAGSPAVTAPAVAARPAGAPAELSAAASPTARGEAGPGRTDRVIASLLAIWALGSLFVAGVSVARILRFQCALRAGRTASSATIAIAEDVARKLGATRLPEILVLPARIPPLLWAVGRPRIVLPLELERAASPKEIEAVLAHEIAHVVRRDHWTRWVELLATVVWWWFPVLWWTRRELRAVEEECCDAWAVWALEGDGAPCAGVVLQTMDLLADGRVSVPSLTSGLSSFKTMKRRLTMMFQSGVERRLRRHERAIALVVAALVLPIAASWSPVAPERPQDGGGSPIGALDTMAIPRVFEELKAGMVVMIDGVPLTQADFGREIMAMHEAGSVETLVRRVVLDLELRTNRVKVSASAVEAELTRLVAAFDPKLDLRAIEAADPRIAMEIRTTAKEMAAWGKLTGDAFVTDEKSRPILTQLKIRQTMDRYKIRKRSAGDDLEPGVLADVTGEDGVSIPIRESVVLDHLRATVRPADLVGLREALIDDYLLGRALQAKGKWVSGADVKDYVDRMTAKYKPPFDWRMICQFKSTTPAGEAMVFRRITAWKRLTGFAASKDDLQKFAAERADYFAGENRNVSLIKIRIVDAITGLPLSQTAQDEAERRIVEIARALEEGLDFGKLAESQSEDRATARGGGALSKPVKHFGSSDEAALREAVYALERVGEISKPFRVRDGWCIVRLDKITPPNPAVKKSGLTEPNFVEWIQDELERGTLADELAQMRAKSSISLGPDEALRSW